MTIIVFILAYERDDDRRTQNHTHTVGMHSGVAVHNMHDYPGRGVKGRRGQSPNDPSGYHYRAFLSVQVINESFNLRLTASGEIEKWEGRWREKAR